MSRSNSSRPVAKTEVRNSPIPKPAPAQQRPSAPSPSGGQRQITPDAIAKRAYEIWQSGQGGSEFDNWLRAERELRGR
jgi:hypothetical protein